MTTDRKQKEAGWVRREITIEVTPEAETVVPLDATHLQACVLYTLCTRGMRRRNHSELLMRHCPALYLREAQRRLNNWAERVLDRGELRPGETFVDGDGPVSLVLQAHRYAQGVVELKVATVSTTAARRPQNAPGRGAENRSAACGS